MDVRGGFSLSCCSTASFELVFVFFTNLAGCYLVYFVSLCISFALLHAVLTTLLEQ